MNKIAQRFHKILPRSIRRVLAEKGAEARSAEFYDAGLAVAAIGDVDEEWRKRIDDVVACTDNVHIPRVPEAGILKEGIISMHNGINVGALGYYGGGILNMLVENRGVHEPQEERAFAEILKHIAPGGTMMELGAYWGFYSMWFMKEIQDGKVCLVEPDPSHVLSGKKNFQINDLIGSFETAYISAKVGKSKDGTAVATVDDLMARHGLQHLSILRSDIQGAELDMLEGAKNLFNSDKIDYVIISTHSDELHAGCLSQLEEYGFQILVSCDLRNTVSVDGVIVAKRKDLQHPAFIEVEGNAIQHQDRTSIANSQQ